ncbi:MAG: hypothetical protein ACQERO_10535 [Bacteroidota bacterium]
MKKINLSWLIKNHDMERVHEINEHINVYNYLEMIDFQKALLKNGSQEF